MLEGPKEVTGVPASSIVRPRSAALVLTMPSSSRGRRSSGLEYLLFLGLTVLCTVLCCVPGLAVSK